MQLARPGRAADRRRGTAERAVHAAHDRQARRARVVGRVTDGEPERREVGAHAPGTRALAGVTAARREQAAHRTTPRMLHMLQTNRPQSAHGYPSDARSSLPQARQVMASRSCRSPYPSPGVCLLGARLSVRAG